MLKRYSVRAVLAFLIALLALYVGDATWVRVRLARHHDPTGSVKVRVLLAVPQKSGRMEYIPGNTETQSCVHSVFPQIGLPPCWYAERHTRREVDY